MPDQPSENSGFRRLAQSLRSCRTSLQIINRVVGKEPGHTSRISAPPQKNFVKSWNRGRIKPDCVAPGETILSVRAAFTPLSDRAIDSYVELSGTSMAAPHVSGLSAAFLSIRREFIGYPDRVKRILKDNFTDVARVRYVQRRGMPNLVRMLVST